MALEHFSIWCRGRPSGRPRSGEAGLKAGLYMEMKTALSVAHWPRHHILALGEMQQGRGGWQPDAGGLGHRVHRDARLCDLQPPGPVMNVEPSRVKRIVHGIEAIPF